MKKVSSALVLLLCMCLILVTGCQSSGGTYDDFYGDFQTSTGDNSVPTSSEGAGDTTTDVPTSTTEGTKNSVATTDPTTTKKPTASTKKPTTTTSQKPLLDPSVVTATNTNLAKGKAVTESGKKIAAFTDGNTTSVAFSGKKGQKAAIELDLGKRCTFNEIWLYESGGLNVKGYSIYVQVGNKWEFIYRQDEIGVKRVCAIQPVTAQKIKIEFTDSSDAYQLCEVEVVNATGNGYNRELRVVSYFTGWATFAIYGPEEMPEFFDVSTDLMYIGDVAWDINGNIHFNRGSGAGASLSTEAEYAKRVANTKACIKATGKDIRLWATVGEVGGGNATLQTLQGDKKTRLIKNIVDFLLKYDFDGVDFDWEYPSGADQWTAYSSFLVDLNKELDKHGLLLSTTHRPHDVHLTPEAIKAVDLVQTMWYFGVPENRQPHTNYRNATNAMEYFLDLGFPSEKIVVGFPFYVSDGGSGELGFSRAVLGGITRWDNIALGKYLLNGPQSVRDKTVMLIHNNLGGLMVWHMTCDTEKSVYGMSLYDEVDQVKKQYLNQ